MEIAMCDDQNARDAGSVADTTGSTAPQEGTKATAIFSSKVCERHAPPAHPETAERVRSVLSRLRVEFPGLHYVEAFPPATAQQLRQFHTQRHVDTMFSVFEQVRDSHEGGGGPSTVVIDEDTVVTHGTEEAALTAVGAVCHAIDTIMQSTVAEEKETQTETETKTVRSPVTNAFCCVRPPGHHAEPDRAMGFCFFNSVGIGALHALKTYADEVSRVLIVDFDVHHGNGTQAKFISPGHSNVKYISTHQSPLFPKTGKRHERGASNNILNVPLVEDTGSTAFRRLFVARVLPAMEQFKPDLVLISAGFDAHEDDPLGNVCLQHDDFYWMTKHIVDVAWRFARGRVVSVLEGGYDLEALPQSVAAHVRALVEGSTPPASSASSDGIDALAAAFAASVRVSSSAAPPDLRVVVHLDAREKLIVLKGERSMDALLAQCQHKFNYRRTRQKPSRALVDRRGEVLTPDALQSLPNDQHLFLR